MKRFSSILAGALLIAGCTLTNGCARWNAAYNMGIQKPYFANRILRSGTSDYTRFLNLSKDAYPALAGYCSDHGNPSIIVPTYSPIADFVWEKQKKTVVIIWTDSIEEKDGIPPKVLEYRAREKAKRSK